LNVRIASGLTAFCFGWLAVSQAFSGEVVSIVDASGRTMSDVTLQKWSTDRIIVQGESPHEVRLDDLLTISFGRPSKTPAAGDPLVILANGDRLVLQPDKVTNDVLTATWHKIPSRERLEFPLETVSAIVFDLPTAADDRQRLYADLQTLPAGDDIVLLTNGDRVQGEFERLDGAFVQLKSAAGLLKVDCSRVRAIRINPDLTIAPPQPGRRLAVALRDGSRFTAHSLELIDHELKCVTSFSKAGFRISAAECVSCRVFGTRAIPLADREPAQVTFVPYLSNQWPLVKNANVLRGPLALRGVEYSSGLGVHSRSLVTYELQPADREFRATVGIDDSANGAGSVRFAIELDSRRVWESPELTGRSQPVTVPPVKLDGAKKLTLIVDFGANADVSDYADWCDAVLVREAVGIRQ
jgi:hypothetical protein